MGPQWGPALQGTSTHRAGARWGRREQPGSFPCTAQAPCSQCTCLHSCVCCVFVFLLHVLPLLSLTPPYILALLCTPQFPSSRHPSSSQELEKPLSGARPLPHPPSQGVSPALPSVLPSVSADGLAGRGVIKEWGRWACLQPASGPISSPPQSQALSPRRTQSRSGPWPFEPPERDLYLSPPPPATPRPFPPRGLQF